MTKAIIKLGDPRLIQLNAERREHYRCLAQEALQAEGINNHDLEFGLMEAGYMVGHGVYPSLFRPESFTQAKRCFEALKAEGRGLQGQIDDLVETINAASLTTQTALNDALVERGLNVEILNAAIEAIDAAAREIAATPMPACTELVEQGRNTSLLNTWVIEVWPHLKPHMSMKAAGRVCSKVFTGDDGKAATFYQSIRNATR